MSPEGKIDRAISMALDQEEQFQRANSPTSPDEYARRQAVEDSRVTSKTGTPRDTMTGIRRGLQVYKGLLTAGYKLTPKDLTFMQEAPDVFAENTGRIPHSGLAREEFLTSLKASMEKAGKGEDFGSEKGRQDFMKARPSTYPSLLREPENLQDFVRTLRVKAQNSGNIALSRAMKSEGFLNSIRTLAEQTGDNIVSRAGSGTNRFKQDIASPVARPTNSAAAPALKRIDPTARIGGHGWMPDGREVVKTSNGDIMLKDKRGVQSLPTEDEASFILQYFPTLGGKK
jgi:hypothetical protein